MFVLFFFQTARGVVKRRAKLLDRMALCSLLSFLLYITVSIPCAVSDQETNHSSIYDVFKEKGLPMGLLPKGVRDFKIDESSGLFEVHLDQACNAKFENELHYDSNVTGKLSYGQIEALSGISAKELFLWFQVKAIRVDVSDAGLICFDVGVVVKKFSVSLFEAPKDCAAAAADEEREEVETGIFIEDAVATSQFVDKETFGRDVLMWVLLDRFRHMNGYCAIHPFGFWKASTDIVVHRYKTTTLGDLIHSLLENSEKQ